EAAAKAGQVPIKVDYPTTRRITAAGIRDAYRELFPDVVAKRGHTWTPLKPEGDPTERHDRIDFVFFGGKGVSVKKLEVVGERKEAADIVVTPYPSDHRAVVGTFLIKN
ncbi:MAG: endonuclease/exonuclease/phosphatase, partial [Limisphaerales bacterium]